MPDIVARGIRLHVETLGGGPRTAVFVHGLVMDNLSSWYFTLANPAATVARAILYDLRGHGRSERPAEGYSIAVMVADLDALLDELRVTGPVELIGNSFGGCVAVAYAIAHPERVSGLVLVDGNLHDERWGPELTRSLALEGAERDTLIVKYAHSWAGRGSDRRRTRLARDAEQLVHGTTLVRDLASSPIVTDAQLTSIACPVLALYGAQSELLDRARRLERLVPRCHLRLFEGRTHLLLWEATDELKDVLVAWLTRPPEGHD